MKGFLLLALSVLLHKRMAHFLVWRVGELCKYMVSINIQLLHSSTP